MKDIPSDAMAAINRALANGSATETKQVGIVFQGIRIGVMPVFAPVGYSLTVRVPVKVRSEMNARDHWAARKRRFDDQAEAFLEASRWLREARPPLPTVITLTHRGRRMDGDNLQSAMKGVRDAVTTWLGLLDDDDARLTWEYKQDLQTTPAMQGVEVTFANRE